MNDKIVTIPNILGFFRILAAPIIMWTIINDHRLATFILLTSSFLTDILDGYIARKFKQISKLGKTLDPIADKFLFGFVILGVSIREELQFWSFLFGILISLYFFGFILIYPIFIKKGFEITKLGKICVFINCIVLLLLVFFFSKWLLLIFTVILITPQISYFIKFRKGFRENDSE
ncbi:MAG: CDP-alcohol phosphatidyltransferase family protein [Candidatus Cloacimonetes bacterium]|nr:CDP-alcohol phosphatidyltransferase family protein [Candidatus Cloacimonadota bacterium]